MIPTRHCDEGDIMWAPSQLPDGPDGYTYCTGCDAFRYSDDHRLDPPSGTDREANRAAWDAGEEQSPEQSPEDDA